ncbi:MAG: hypothetical protein SPE21_02255 [Candidatus Cryptobacteroides sp.]|nr:hypothetical protein [Candidatus Cryptobacteroides sp.]
MKFRKFWAVAACVIAVSCNGKIDNPDNGNNTDNSGNNNENEPGVNAVNLSASGTANCYVIDAAGEYAFDASLRGNGASSQGLETPQPLSPSSAKLLWQDSKSMISSVSLSGTRVVFTAGSKPGNAVIAVENASGEIIWSWHIWHPEKPVSGLTTSKGYTLMNMNLGAISSELGLSAYGLLYQWGRKDPFPGSPIASGGTIQTKSAPVYDIDGNETQILASSMFESYSNNLAYAIAHPNTCLSCSPTKTGDWLLSDESSPALWGNPEGGLNVDGKYINNGGKSIYDPCPAGWRVPPADLYSNFTGSGQYAWVELDSEGNPQKDENGNMVISYTFGQDSYPVCDMNADGILSMEDYNNGWVFRLGDDTSSYFPASTRYDATYALLMGSMVGLWGNYWTNAPSVQSNGTSDSAIAMGFAVKDMYGKTNISISPNASGPKANAFAVRCIKE